MIIQKSKIKTKQPIVFFSWPSIGMIGNYVINHLISQLKPSLFAEIEIDEYIVSNTIVENGIIYSNTSSYDKIYYSKQKQGDFLFISANLEPSIIYYKKFADELINFFEQLEVSLIITFHALPSYILHTDYPQIYIAKNMPDIKIFNEVKNLKFGTLEGINAVLLTLARDLAIKGVCIFCEIPFYTIDMINPQAAIPIIELLKKTFSFDLGFSTIYEDIKKFDEKIKDLFVEIDKKTQKFFKQLNTEIKNPILKPKKQNLLGIEEGITFEELKKQIKFSLPQSAKNKINELFKLASENIEYAKQLKEELDKWGVYKEYEDKFLLLFLKNKKTKPEEEKE
ncbi:MAG: PAC2 family protein [Endomicrobiia bacterium]